MFSKFPGVRLMLCLLLTLVILGPAAAQEYRGRIQGIVTDTSDAVVVGARVTLTGVETGVDTIRQTDQNGYYLFDMVLPGNYMITVELEGFNKFIQENILIQTRDDITVNARMEVGAVSESVTVSSSPVAVKFNTTSMETTIDSTMVKNLPVINRNPFLLALLDPAVNTTFRLSTPFSFWSTSTIEIGGEQTNRANDILLDGNPVQMGQKGSYAPPMDSVSEVTVQQNSVDAEFGHTTGGILQVAMKSGTNDVHGSLYYFGRNPLLNARTNPMTDSPNKARNHSWGGSVGLPVVKNKLFLFSAYEGWKTSEPLSKVKTMPTDLERVGNFSQTLNSQGKMRQIFDPFSTRFDPESGAVVRDAFPGNIIPSSRIDPTSATMMSYIWGPNNPGNIDGSQNFRTLNARLNDYYNVSNRADWVITDKLRMFGRYSTLRTLVDETDYTGIGSKLSGIYGANWDSDSVAVDMLYTMNPTTVLNLRTSYTMMSDNYDNRSMRMTQEDLDKLWPGNPYYRPYMEIRGVDTPLYHPTVYLDGSLLNRTNMWIQQPVNYSAAGKLSKQMGRHYVKFGGEWRYFNMRGHWARQGMSNFRFNTSHTADTFLNPNTKLRGYNWATFLLGAIDNQSYIQGQPLGKHHFHYASAFVQDDFKVNKRVTLNLGLRWEYEFPVKDIDGRLSRGFDLSDPIPEMQTNPPDIPQEALDIMNQPYQFNGAWHFTDGPGQGMYDPKKLNLSPRIGIAIRLNDRMSLRAGFARFERPAATQVSGIMVAVPMNGFDAQTSVAPALEGIPQAVVSDPWPSSNPLILPKGKSLGRYQNLGDTANWIKQDLRPNVNNRFNVSFQRQLPNRFLIDTTYFLNLGSNMPYTHNFNMMDPQLSYQYKAQLSQSVDNPFYNYGTEETFPGSLRNQQKVKLSDLLKPYPQYIGLTQSTTEGPRIRYSSIQIKLQRPFVNGFNFLLGYNYNSTKKEEFFSGDQQFLNQWDWERTQRGRHKLNIAGMYEFPFGKGRRYLGDANAVVDAILGGWATTGILTYISGDSLRFGALQEVGDPVISNPDKWGRWFSADAFEVQPAFTPRSNPKWYPDLWGPMAISLDMALAKSFHLTERFRLELRMEAENLTNTFNAANPGSNVSSATFGVVTGPKAGYFGRQFQYNLKLYF